MRIAARFRFPLYCAFAAFACAENTAATAPAAKSALEKPDVPAGGDAARIADLATKAQPLVDAFLNSEALLSRDGKQVIFVSHRAGHPQLYPSPATPPRPDSFARRLFDPKERVALEGTTPDGKAIFFRSDQGADEKWSIFRAGLDGSPPVQLTTGERMQRDRVQIADLAPETIY